MRFELDTSCGAGVPVLVLIAPMLVAVYSKKAWLRAAPPPAHTHAQHASGPMASRLALLGAAQCWVRPPSDGASPSDCCCTAA